LIYRASMLIQRETVHSCHDHVIEPLTHSSLRIRRFP
jgi:hypothetical protein